MLRNLLTKLKLLYMLDLDTDAGTMSIGDTRVFVPPTRVLSATRNRLIDIGPAAQRFMYEAGKAAGREYADAVEQLGVSIQTEEEFVDLCESFGTLTGWGNIHVAEADFANNEYTVEIKNTLFESDADERVCEYNAGMLAGAAEHILGTAMDTKETSCMNRDAAVCTFDMREEDAFDSLF